MTAPASTHGNPALVSEVRLHCGAPTLFINGEPHTGLSAWLRTGSPCLEQMLRDFGGVGIHLYDTPLGPGTARPEPGRPRDFSFLHAKMSTILAADPNALLILEVGVTPPTWWQNEHPDDLAVHLEADTLKPVENGGCAVSFASQAWRRDMGEMLREYVLFMEQHHAGRVVGYHIHGGDAGEWDYSWRQVMSDYSPVHRSAYQAWLRARYGDDVAKLQAAWGDSAATFETVEVPRDRAMPAGATAIDSTPTLLDPVKDRRLVDYLTFHNEVPVETALHFCHIAKSALASLGRTKIVGIYFGYHFWHPRSDPYWFHNSGHHALGRVLASSDVDFFVVPHTYQERDPGGFYLSQIVTGSLRLHGKLMFSEEDSQSYLAKGIDLWPGHGRNIQGSLGIYRRNFLGAYASGHTQWWMNLFEDYWFHEPTILADIRRMRELAEERLGEDRSPDAQVAVITSEKSPRFLRYGRMTPSLLGYQVPELARMGAPFDCYRVEDLERILDQPWGAGYRLLVFLDTFYLTDAEREGIGRKAARGGRTLLFVYASGLITDDGFSVEAMRNLTGITIALRPEAAPPKVDTHITGSRLSYGCEERFGPVLVGDDPAAEVLGWLQFPARPGLLRRRLAGWTSVWSTAPAIPAAVLQHIAREAGVHLYNDTGDQVLACRGLLGLHAWFTGDKLVRLPSMSDVTDALSGEAVCRGEASFSTPMQRGETRIWKVAGSSRADRNSDRKVQSRTLVKS